MYILAIFLITLPAVAQIEYRSGPTHATILYQSSSASPCTVTASLAADMEAPVPAAASEVEYAASRDGSRRSFILEAEHPDIGDGVPLEPGQRYFVRVDCGQESPMVGVIRTEPQDQAITWAETNCSVPPREIAVMEEGGEVTLDLRAECGESLRSTASWVRFTPSSGNAAEMIVEPNDGAARFAVVKAGDESVVVRQAAATNCSFAMGGSWYPGTGGSYTLSIPAPAGCSWVVASVPA